MIAAHERLARHYNSVDGPVHACLARSARQKSGPKAANRPQGADEAECAGSANSKPIVAEIKRKALIMTCLVNPEINNSRNGSKAVIREGAQQRLALALAAANDPATVFCVQPFTSVECDGGKNLGRLLTRVMRDPDHALVIATGTAFVFAFVNQLARGENRGGFPVDPPETHIRS